jgi:hypothetical protein
MVLGKDWFPHRRMEILVLCRMWIAFLTAARRAAWGISAEEWAALNNLFTTAEERLAQAQDVSERTHVISVACHEAFVALEAKMRFFKDRYFKIPPLTKEDLAALGLKERDPHPTPSGRPTAQVMVKTFMRGPREIGIDVIYVSGNPHDKANSGYRVWYSVIGPGGAGPRNREQRRRRRERSAIWPRGRKPRRGFLRGLRLRPQS